MTFFPYFVKQPNSTKDPTEYQDIMQTAVTYSCKLWEGCSYMAPTIELNLSGNTSYGDPYLFKYCEIPSLHRFYHIFDWRFSNGLWIASLQVDVLTSFKSNIGVTWVFADRCADRLDDDGNFVDTGMLDNLLPTRIEPKVFKETTTLTHLSRGSGFYFGTYVVGIINSDDTAVGAVSYYAMDNRNFRRFMSAMLSGSYLGTADISRETQKAILNPFQYVATCNWFPFSIEQVTGSAQPTMLDNLRLGWWTLPGAANGGPNYYNIATLGKYETIHQFRLYDHPCAGPLKMRMWNYEPYTQYEITCPYFGNFALTRSQIPDGLATALFSYDLVSGLCQLRIYDGQVDTEVYPDEAEQITQTIGRCKLVRTLSGQAACPIQIAQTTSDYGAARVTQINASATVMSNSAALAREYVSAKNDRIMAIGNMFTGIATSIATGNLAGGISAVGGGLLQHYAASQNYDAISRYTAPAVRAQNAAARASASYTSATQRAPVVETSGNNGSNLEPRFPFELRCSYLLPVTLTGDPYYYAHDIPEALFTRTKQVYDWMGYPYGRWTRINKHSGFIQGHDPIITSTVATETELDAIKDFIGGGIIYE